MKISLNFYLDELKPKKYYLTLTNLLAASVVAAIVFVIWISVISMDIEQAKNDLAEMEAKNTQAQLLLTKLQGDLVKHNDKATFNDQKLNLDKKLKAKLMLWEGVGKRLQTTTTDYYLVLKELTEHHDHELWLSKFSFNDKVAIFEGFALDSSAVTRWMTYLKASNSFQGREFSHLNVRSIDEELMEFEIATSIALVKTEEPEE